MNGLLPLLFFGLCIHDLNAQGTVIFNNRISGTLATRVYLGGIYWLAGNGADDTPSGTVDWAGFTALTGSGWSAQLLAAPGSDRTLSSLVPAQGVTTFRTGTAAGNVAPITATLVGVAKDAPVATIAMAVWDNHAGVYPDWSSASVAWQNGLTVAAISPSFNVLAIGGDVNVPPVLQGLQSFTIYLIPEPGSISLFGTATVFALLARRRSQCAS